MTWHEQPLRDREYDVVVKFRVTADNFPAAVENVRRIVERDQFQRHIVPMFVPLQTDPVVVSGYAMQHADYYGLRKTTRYGGRVVGVELALMDLDGEFIDEAGCNCDLDDPCNNPRCVMERGDGGRGAAPTHRR